MLLVAKKKEGVYDSLAACDCVAYLHRNVKPATADLIIAADVLVYMRDLADLFDEVVAALHDLGVDNAPRERVAAVGHIRIPFK